MILAANTRENWIIQIVWCHI